MISEVHQRYIKINGLHMEKYKCKICEKKLTMETPYIGSHVKRCHDISLEKYALLFYKEINRKEDRNCVSCSDKITPKIKFNFSSGTFEKMYDGFICPSTRNTPTLHCKNNISRSVLGTEYDKKIYEHIGSKKEFLMLKYQINSEEAVLLKNVNLNKIFKENPGLLQIEIEKIYNEKIKKRRSKPKNNLEGFIERHGGEIGKKLYNENCRKIGRANTLEFYIEKYGEEIALEKWAKKFEENKKKLGSSISNASKEFSKKIKECGVEFIPEYPVRVGNKGIIVDFYLPQSNIIIEFFGDYWHCNPKIYNSDYYHKIMKITASQKWELDKKRIDSIINLTKASVLIFWESSIVSPDEILSLINDIKGKNSLFVI